jgi:Spy/CpxP family protein refolding chaperone
MKNKVLKLAIAGAMALALSAPSMFAQTADATATAPPDSADHIARMVQHRVNYMTTVLSLTTAQQTQVKTILTTAATNSSSTHASMKAARTALDTAIHSNDAAGMEQAATTIGLLTTQETLAHAKTEAAVFQALTPEQQTKMTQLEADGPHGFGHRGPGGPGL